MLENMLQTLLVELQKFGRTETVIGKEIHAGKSTVIPISRVQIGFGVGSTGNGSQSTSKMSGTGSGGGLRIEPVACLVVNDNGHAQLLQLQDPSLTTAGKIMDLVPDVMNRLGWFKDSHDGESNTEKSPRRESETRDKSPGKNP